MRHVPSLHLVAPGGMSNSENDQYKSKDFNLRPSLKVVSELEVPRSSA